jgi:hypothetical protein
MNNYPLQNSAPTGNNVYAIIRNQSVQVWSTESNEFVNWVDANYSQYVYPLAEQGTSGFYFALLPTDLTQVGPLSVEYFIGSGTNLDQQNGGGTFWWNGSSVTPTPPTGPALTSLSYVKDVGQIQTSLYDSFLQNRIYAISQAVLDFTHNNFFLQDYVEILDGPGSTELLVSNRPVTSVTSVITNYYSTYGSTYESDQLLFKPNGIISVMPGQTVSYWFDYQPQSISVSYSAGFEEIPLDVQDVVANAVMRAYYRAGTDQTLSSESLMEYSRTSRMDAGQLLNQDDKIVLRKYRTETV